jgi:hypothetical protein
MDEPHSRLELVLLRRDTDDTKLDVRDLKNSQGTFVRRDVLNDELRGVYEDVGQRDAAAAEKNRSLTSRVEEIAARVDGIANSFNELQTAFKALVEMMEPEGSGKSAPRRFSMQKLDWRVIAAAFLAIGAAGGKTAEIIFPTIAARFLGG